MDETTSTMDEDAKIELYFFGALVKANTKPAEIPPAIGKVKIHPNSDHKTILQLIDRASKFINPTPTVAPVITCVVETGIPANDAVTTVSAAPSSMQNPRDGEWYVILFPKIH